MSRFIDEYLPECIPGYPCVSTPVWGNVISRVSSGAENVRQIWSQPLHSFSLPVATRKHETIEALKSMWFITAGNAKTFPFRDPMDFASVALEAPNQIPVISNMDQFIGTGDGVNRDFQLVKRYEVGAEIFDRIIYLPVVDSILVSINGTNSTAYTATRYGGIITFDTPPDDGDVIRAGFLFDVEVRFADNDTYAGVMRAFTASGFQDITLLETRPC